MFERVITQTIQRISSEVLRDRQSVPLTEILEDERIPSRFKPFFATEVRWWLYNDALARGANKRFDFAHPELASLVDYLEQVMFRHARFEHDEFVSTLDGAVKLTFNYLCRPQTTLKWYIFRGQPVKPLSEVMLRFESFLDYEYIGNVFAEWVERKVRERATFEAISATEFERIIRRIDDQILLSCTVDELLGLLDPIFDFIGEGDDRLVPIDALIIFFDDKNIARLVDHLERYRAPNAVVSRARFVGILEELLTSAEENPDADFSSVYQNDELDDIVQRHLEAEGRIPPPENHSEPSVARAAAPFDESAPAQSRAPITDPAQSAAPHDQPAPAQSEAPHEASALARAVAPVAESVVAPGAATAEQNAAPAAAERMSPEGAHDEPGEPHGDTGSPPVGAHAADLDSSEGSQDERDEAEGSATSAQFVASSGVASSQVASSEVASSEQGAPDVASSDVASSEEGAPDVAPPNAMVSDEETDRNAATDSSASANGSIATPEVAPVNDPESAFGDGDESYDLDAIADALESDETAEETSAETLSPPRSEALTTSFRADDVSDAASVDDVVATLEESTASVAEVATDVQASPAGTTIDQKGPEAATEFAALDPMLERKVFKKIFNRDRAAFDDAMARLAVAPTWRQAAMILDSLFIRFDIDPYSRTAKRFADTIHERYLPKSHT